MTESVAVLDEAPYAGDMVSRRPGPRDFLWLTWAQQGGVLGLSALAVLALGVLLLVAQAHFSVLPCTGSDHLLVPGQELPCDLAVERHLAFVDRSAGLLRVVVLLPVLVAVFWGAPLVAREYEQGTHGLAWGQGASPRRWLLGRVASLAVAAVGLAVPLWVCVRLVAESLSRTSQAVAFDGSRFSPLAFVSLAPMVVPYTLLALAIGVLCSVLVRRTLPAIALAAVVCVGLGLATSQYLRPHYLPAASARASVTAIDVQMPTNALFLDEFAWADKHGRPVSYPEACSPDVEPACLAQHGITGRVTIYQPGSREAGFQWIEATLAMLLAAGCLSIAVWRVRPT